MRARWVPGPMAVAVAVAVTAALVGTAAARPTTGPPPSPFPPAAAGSDAARSLAGPGGPLALLPLQTADRRIVDTAGRDVLLRGANVNALAEYWQGVPGLPTTVDLTDADWDLMAARGFSVVRLLITWSRVEPTRGVIDHAYLDRVDAAVDQAARRGIYTVIDMHQDAYSATHRHHRPGGLPARHPAGQGVGRRTGVGHPHRRAVDVPPQR